jgi:periplasmic protein TonB
MALRKYDSADLRKKYPLFVQGGLILSLTLLIVAFRVDWNPGGEVDFGTVEQEIVQIEEIEQTKHVETPPPPPRPPVPIEVPNDELLDDVDLDFLDAELDQNRPLDLPPPPPPRAEVVEEPEPEVFIVVEEMPELIGGLESIQRMIRYPEIARKAGVEGRVFVQFTVDEQGNVVDPEVTRGIGAGCDEEAVRAIRQAKFTPGKQRGKAVKVRMSLPITFRLR